VMLTCPRISSLSWKLIQGARQTPYTLCRFLPIQSSNFVLLCFLLIYDSFVCCLSRLSEIIVLAPHQRWLKKLGGWFSTFTLTPSARLPIPKPGHSQPSHSHHLLVFLFLSLVILNLRHGHFGFSHLTSNRNLTRDLLSVRCRDGQFTARTDLYFLVLSSVKDFQDVLAQVIAGASFHRSTL